MNKMFDNRNRLLVNILVWLLCIIVTKFSSFAQSGEGVTKNKEIRTNKNYHYSEDVKELLNDYLERNFDLSQAPEKMYDDAYRRKIDLHYSLDQLRDYLIDNYAMTSKVTSSNRQKELDLKYNQDFKSLSNKYNEQINRSNDQTSQSNPKTIYVDNPKDKQRIAELTNKLSESEQKRIEDSNKAWQDSINSANKEKQIAALKQKIREDSIQAHIKKEGRKYFLNNLLDKICIRVDSVEKKSTQTLSLFLEPVVFKGGEYDILYTDSLGKKKESQIHVDSMFVRVDSVKKIGVRKGTKRSFAKVMESGDAHGRSYMFKFNKDIEVDIQRFDIVVGVKRFFNIEEEYNVFFTCVVYIRSFDTPERPQICNRTFIISPE